jgi:hypothetical protein
MLHQYYRLIISSCLVVSLCSAGDRCASAEPKAEHDAALSRRIDNLIRRLGDKRFAERERAQKELVELGEPRARATAGGDHEP